MKLKCKYCSHIQNASSTMKKCSVCNKKGFELEQSKDNADLNDNKLTRELVKNSE